MAIPTTAIAELLTSKEAVAKDICNYCLGYVKGQAHNPMAELVDAVTILEQNYNQSVRGVIFGWMPQYLDCRSRREDVVKFKKDIIGIVTKNKIEEVDRITCMEKIRDFIKTGNWNRDSSANMIFMTELIKKMYGVTEVSDQEYIKTWLESLVEGKKMYWALKNNIAEIVSIYRCKLYNSAPI